MINYIKELFSDSFGFNELKFEKEYFIKFGLDYEKIGYINEHWIYKHNDLTYKVNEMECLVIKDEKEIFNIEFIHNMKINIENLFYYTRDLVQIR